MALPKIRAFSWRFDDAMLNSKNGLLCIYGTDRVATTSWCGLLVHGQWSSWSSWSRCSVSCGYGNRRRTRRCDNPAPRYGGRSCYGSSSSTETCKIRNCPGHATFLTAWHKQEAQLSQRDRATLRVIEYFAKSHKVTQGHSKWHCWVGRLLVPIYSIPLKLCLYLVPFLRYSASNNGVTLKSWVRVVQGRWIWRRSIDHIRLTIGCSL